MRSRLLLPIAVLPLVFFMPSLAPADPDAAEIAAVSETLELYFKGAETNEAKYFEQAFDVPNAHMKALRMREGEEPHVQVTPIADAIANWTRGEPQETWGKIHKVRIIDDYLASAEVEILFKGHVYIDLMTLYKVGENWKIVNKTFRSRGEPAR
ncbi:MAG: nuclear transport factor 2 family protein [Planctomycetota bacterium]|jgi:hypothetical protein